MCLTLDLKKTEKFIKKPIDIVVFKLLKLNNSGLTSLYHRLFWHPYSNVSDRGLLASSLTEHEKTSRNVERGFHSFETLDDAKKIFEKTTCKSSSVLKRITISKGPNAPALCPSPNKDTVYIDTGSGSVIVPLLGLSTEFIAVGTWVYDGIICSSFIHRSLYLGVNTWATLVRIGTAKYSAVELAKYTKKKK